MSEIKPAATQPQATITDTNTASNRGNQTSGQTAPATTAPASTAAPTDSVTLSAAAQASTGQAGGAALTEAEAQDTSTSLRQQLGLHGLSASAKQNASVLALLRPGR
jgi:hypothetical protein